MTQLIKPLATFALVALIALPLAACNTFEGLGEDTQAAGQTLEKAATENKNY